MPLLLTREDLRPLLHDQRMLEEAFDAVQASFLHHQRGEAPSFPLVQLPLVDRASVVRVTPAASPVGLTLRAYPGVPTAGGLDAFSVLVFDAESGRLLALMAGDDLNVCRTAVPAGLACRLLAPGHARTLALLGSGRQAHGQARHPLRRGDRALGLRLGGAHWGRPAVQLVGGRGLVLAASVSR